MELTISQANNKQASACVRVFVNGAFLGCIGPGESLTTTVDNAEPWKVEAVCGLLRAELCGIKDASIQVAWVPSPARMELRAHGNGVSQWTG